MPDDEPLRVMIQDSPFLFRRARPADAPAVAALSSQIWEGEDYVPDVFDGWVADESGQFTMVYDGERLAGFGKLTELGPGEWWLEGLRVDPAYRGRGVARAMHHFAVELFDRTGQGMLRFATSSENTPVHKIAGESGFRLVSQHTIAEAEAVPAGSTAGLVAVTAGELPGVLAWLEQSPAYRAKAGLMEDTWTWLEIRPRLARWQEQGQLFWWQERAGVVMTHLIEPELLWLNYLDAPADTLPPVLAAVQALAAGLGAIMVKSKPLATPEIGTALSAAGWRVHQHQMRLYERPKV